MRVNGRWGCALFSLCALCVLCGRFFADQPRKIDPAAWGEDHVGKPVPEYLTGDECLFCHRKDVGPVWGQNRHHLSLRAVEPDAPELAALKRSPAKNLAAEVKLVLGSKNHHRFLKPSTAYGKLELLDADRPQWDDKKFGDACAGCHATGVDSAARSFSAPSLDCFVCHGNVDPKHANDTALVHLSRKRNDPARVVTSVCAQCHLRTGRSRSTGLRYPNNFVAGDNLFRDFQVDLADAALLALNPADRHVQQNVREVVVEGRDEVTCLSCHEVHKQSTKNHRRLARTDLCRNCHEAEGSLKTRKPYEVHSKTCGY